jgi:molybdenum cofactor synthesis domain-containing protein
MAEAGHAARAAILTVSDGVAAGVRDDDTGAAIARQLADDGYEVITREVVADERGLVAETLARLAGEARLVVTNGGTGLGPRDVTPEATGDVVTTLVPGLAEAMRADGRRHTPMADLSRGVAGAVGETLVINLPGSPTGAVESHDAVRAALGHALRLLAGDTSHGHGDAGGGHGHQGHAQPHHGHEHHGSQQEGHVHGSQAGARTHVGGPGAEHADAGGADGHGRAAGSPDRVAAAAGETPGAAEVHAELARRTGAGERTVLATAVRTEGEPPCSPGMAVLVGGEPTTARTLAGTLGCAEFDEAVVAEAPAVLAQGEARVTRLPHAHGSIEVQLQPFVPGPPLIVLGATSVASVLLRWGAELGWTPVLVESRPERVDAHMRQAAARVVDGVDALELGRDAVAVHTDHDAPDIDVQLTALLRADVRRIEVMGSRRHSAPVLEWLAAEGFADAVAERVHRPAGLDLGGRSPAEIALAILAALVADRHQAPVGQP